MSRETFIREAADKYIDIWSTGTYCSADPKEAFIEGADYADANPQYGLVNLSKIWHGVNEMPELEQWFIAQIGEKVFDVFVSAMDKNDTWAKWSKGMNITRWAYINDLLPKGSDQ